MFPRGASGTVSSFEAGLEAWRCAPSEPLLSLAVLCDSCVNYCAPGALGWGAICAVPHLLFLFCTPCCARVLGAGTAASWDASCAAAPRKVWGLRLLCHPRKLFAVGTLWSCARMEEWCGRVGPQSFAGQCMPLLAAAPLVAAQAYLTTRSAVCAAWVVYASPTV